MPSDRSSAGDPSRTLALLWRTQGAAEVRRGPRRGLGVDEVIDAALGIADDQGIETLGMRGVASALGIAPMSLYTYVPGKAELLDLMLDTVYARMPRTPPATDGWRARLVAVAEDNRAMYARHPWVAAVATTRPPLGPGLMAKYERELSALDGLGLDDVTRDAALAFLLSFVRDHARTVLELRASRTGDSDAAWWAANAPLLARVLDPVQYPTAVRVGAAAGAAHGATLDPAHAWQFGLARVIDGLEALFIDGDGTAR